MSIRGNGVAGGIDLQTRRQNALKTMRENKMFLNEWESHNAEQHRAAVRTRRLNEMKDVEFEMTMKERREKRKEMKEKSVLNDFQSSIMAFENKLSTTNTSKPPQLKDPKAFIAKIKTKKETEVIARKDRDQRRRKFLLDQGRMMEDLEAQRRRELKYEALMQESKAERQLVKKLSETLKWKTVMKRNREYREQQYEEQRKADEAKKLEATQLERQQREEERKRTHEILLKRFQEREELKRQKNAKKVDELCEGVVDGLLRLTEKNAQYKEHTEGIAPSEIEEEEWREEFVHDSIQEENFIEDSSVTSFLNERQLKNYLTLKGVWKVDSPPANSPLPGILSRIEKLINPPPSLAQASDLEFKSRHPIRLSILGKPFSGKSIFSRQLAEKYQLEVIKPEELMDYCVSHTEHPLHHSIHQELKLGKPVSISLMVDLIMDEVKKLEERTDIRGWILDGYPNTVESAIALEERLSGYKELIYNPKKSSFFDYNVEDIESMRHPFKSFSKLIIIETSNKEVFKRQAGQCYDPETNEVYHILYAPPPNDQTILSRLVSIDEVQIDRVQINDQVIAFNKNQTKIQEFYSKNCSTDFFLVDGDREPETIFNELDELTSCILQEAEVEHNEDKTVLENKEEPTEDASAEDVDELAQIESEQESVKGKLELKQETATMLSDIWYSIEEKYNTIISTSLQTIRTSRKKLLHQLQLVKDEFIAILKERDVEKQVAVLQFQEEFNKIDQDMRTEPSVKSELHLRLKELREKLWKICEGRKSGFSSKIEALKSQQWYQEIRVAITRCFMQLLQMEVTRYSSSVKFISDFYYELNSFPSPIDPSVYEGKVIDIIGEDPSAKKKTSAPPKKGKEETAFDPQIPHDFEATFERAKAVLEIPVNQPMDKKGKPIVPKKGKLPLPDKIQEIEDGITCEKELFIQRIDAVKAAYSQMLNDVDTHWTYLQQTLEKWMNERYQSEIGAVRDLCIYVENYIENSLPMENELKLSDDTFGVDEFIEVFSEPPFPGEDPSLQLVEGATIDFTRHQLQQLISRFKASAPSGFISTDEFVTLMFGLSSSSFGNIDLPQRWMNATLEDLTRIAEEVSIPGTSGVINWREFITTNCILSRYNSTPSPTEILCTIKGYYSAFNAFYAIESETIDGLKCEDLQAIPHWYHTKTPTNLSLSPLDITACLYDIFHESSLENPVDLSWHIFALLYQCLDIVPIKSIKNMFFALSEGEGGITKQQMYQLFNFNLQEVKEEFGMDQIDAVFEEVSLKSASGEPHEDSTITFEAFCDSSFGRNLIKQATHLRKKLATL